jgi:hypothetical protein
MKSVPIGGGTSTTLASDFSSASNMTADATNVYVSDYALSGRIAKIPVGGGTETTLASGQIYPYTIVVDGSFVYWVNYGNVIFSPTFSVTGAALMRVPVAGGTPTQLAASADDLHGLVVDASYVYYTSRSEVRKVPKAGGAPIVLAGGLDFPFQIVQTATSLYWTNYSASTGAILRLAK